MKKINRISKLFLYLTVLSFIIWLGGYITRLFVVYEFYSPAEMELKELFRNSATETLLPVLRNIININLFSFALFLIGFILFLISSKIDLRSEGWLFISTIIIFITAPFEIYLTTIDWEILGTISEMNPKGLFVLLKERITSLGSFSLIEIFSYFTIVYLFLFRPFRKLDQNEN